MFGPTYQTSMFNKIIIYDELHFCLFFLGILKQNMLRLSKITATKTSLDTKAAQADLQTTNQNVDNLKNELKSN